MGDKLSTNQVPPTSKKHACDRHILEMVQATFENAVPTHLSCDSFGYLF